MRAAAHVVVITVEAYALEEWRRRGAAEWAVERGPSSGWDGSHDKGRSLLIVAPRLWCLVWVLGTAGMAILPFSSFLLFL